MIRLCPNCRRELDSGSYYFCQYCALELPQELRQLPTGVKTVPYTPPVCSNKDPWLAIANYLYDLRRNPEFKRFVFLFFVGMLISTVLFFYLRESIYSKAKSQKTAVSVPCRQCVVVPDSSALEIDFGKDDLAAYVPAEAVAYFEGSSLPEVGVSEPFVVFALKSAKGYEWGGVFFAEIKHNPLFTDLQKDYMQERVLIGTNSMIFELVKSAKTRQTLNMSLNPVFISALRKVSSKGRLLVVFTAPEGKEALKQARVSPQVPKTLQKLIEQIVNSGYNELVITEQ